MKKKRPATSDRGPVHATDLPPPRGPQGSQENIRRTMWFVQRSMDLGMKYRAATPVAKRSYLAWLRFLRRHELRLYAKVAAAPRKKG